ncbi:GNAT family N-acetyltransferase [Streptomyces somaliensis DSM 40738]|uniref:GNAT family N-acetyltransferase n=1 Tax=Streptomyces somaliensis TaxID=78355 RepID=UPI0021C2E1B2|nr:GNAT family N-acetyltransferase [Streptomyces somaliensis]MCQ0024451.1 GNAT family N-acetyltransferase [Streptomyces somaliensis DSM 40738]
MSTTGTRSPAAGVRWAGDLTVTVCREDRRFAGLAAEWADLYRRCPAATPFQTHAWLHSWWLSYGVPGRLRLVLVRRPGDGRLVAAAPLWLTRARVPTLAFLGGALTDYGDVLADEGCPEAVPSLATALADLAAGAVVDLREVRPGAAAERLLACWPGPRARLPDSVCLELPPVPVEEITARLPSSGGQRARAKLRRIDRQGVGERAVPAEEVPRALRRLLDLHRRQWAGREVTAEHLTERFAEHLGRAVRAMAESGHARVTEFLVGGDVVAADLTLLSPRLSGGYLYGADPVLRSLKVDTGALLLRNGLRLAGEAGCGTLSLLRGDEPYKHHWRPSAVRNRRLLLARRRAAPVLWLRAAYAGGRSWAADRLRGRPWALRLRRALRSGRVPAAPTGRTGRHRAAS